MEGLRGSTRTFAGPSIVASVTSHACLPVEPPVEPVLLSRLLLNA